MKNKIFSEPCYDLDELTNYNLHVHSFFSSCAKREMSPAEVIAEAERCNIKVLAFTDHMADEDRNILWQNSEIKTEVQKTGTQIRVLYGAELSGCGIGKYTDTDEQNAGLDYRLYSCNHFHVDCWDHPEDKSARGYAKFSYEIVSSIIKSGRADAIAHPLIGRFVNAVKDKKTVTDELTDNELGELLSFARDYDVAWEINRGAVFGYPEFAYRFWNLGKEIGTTFHYGCDSHNLESLDPKENLDKLKKILLEAV